jgi:hypothetical protein
MQAAGGEQLHIIHELEKGIERQGVSFPKALCVTDTSSRLTIEENSCAGSG